MRFVLSIVALLALSGVARAQETAPVASATTLPWNPFANGKVGEWESLVLKAAPLAKNARGPMQFLMTFRIAKIEGDLVSVKTEAQIPGLPAQDPKLRAYSRKEAPTIEAFLSLQGETLSDLKTTEEKKTVGGREFACTKLTYTTVKKRRLNETTMTMTKKAALWLSKDVKGSGLVAMSIEQSVTDGTRAQNTTSEAEVVGFGSGDTVEFGKKPEDIDLGTKPGKKP